MFAVRPDVVVRTLTARGLLGLELPHRRARQLLALQRWGYGIAGELRAAAAVSGSRVALIDERGAHTYSEAVDLGDRLARVLRSRGLPAGARVGLLAPNGVEFVLALYAANLLGIDLVLLNTGLTGERITQIADRDDLQTVLHDGELAHLVGGVAAAYDLGELMTQARDAAYGPSGNRLAPAREEGRTIVLTSGTTGVPKGAPRRAVGRIGATVSILERIPLHHRTGSCSARRSSTRGGSPDCTWRSACRPRSSCNAGSGRPAPMRRSPSTGPRCCSPCPRCCNACSRGGRPPRRPGCRTCGWSLPAARSSRRASRRASSTSSVRCSTACTARRWCPGRPSRR
ncbi:MAG: AMP-binding protein, partial [Tetrasphaera sp.]|nr:AMP-binding protein [Tetrasphaera sp.]